MLVPPSRAVKNPEAERGARHTLFSKLTLLHRRPQSRVLTVRTVLRATTVMLVSAWGLGNGWQ